MVPGHRFSDGTSLTLSEPMKSYKGRLIAGADVERYGLVSSWERMCREDRMAADNV